MLTGSHHIREGLPTTHPRPESNLLGSIEFTCKALRGRNPKLLRKERIIPRTGTSDEVTSTAQIAILVTKTYGETPWTINMRPFDAPSLIGLIA
jgi:hypothetical protein